MDVRVKNPAGFWENERKLFLPLAFSFFPMACASCGNNGQFERITTPYCSKCRVFICRRCVEEFMDDYRCPHCSKYPIGIPLFAGFLFLISVLILLSLSLLFLVAENIETHYEWDRMEVISIDETKDHDYVKLVGRINSSEEVVLHRYRDQEDRWQWGVHNFYLVNGNESIFVNMSDYFWIIENEISDDRNMSYRNNDTVYVVGLIYFEDGEKCILATHIVFEERYTEHVLAFMGFLALIPIVSTMVYWGPEGKNLVQQFSSRRSITKNDFPDFRPKYITLLDGKKNVDFQETFTNKTASSIMTVFLIIGFLTILFSLLILLAVIDIIPSVISWERSPHLFIISTINAVSLMIVSMYYPRLTEQVIVKNDGLYFTLGFSDPEMITWENIDDAWERGRSIKLLLKDDTFILIPILNTFIREEALAQIATFINERMVSDMKPGDGPYGDGAT